MIDHAQETDGALVLRTRAGDREAFGALVARYERVIGALSRQKVGRAADAEDIVQEAFLKAYAALDDLREPERFGPWLYGIAFRVAIDHLRRRGRGDRVVSLDGVRAGGAAEPTAPAGLAEEAAVRREEIERALEALGALPDRYRLVLTLRYQKQMSYRAIAEHLDEPPGTVANRLHRAIGMLKARLAVPAA